MKTMLKKLTAFLLAASILLTFSFSAAAAQEVTPEAENAVSEDAADIQNNDENEIVATVSVCSCIYVFPISGHTWIYVENLSDKVQRVGLYDLPVGQGVSIGSFSFSVSDGWGIYYNLEAYRENRDNNSANHWSITKELTQEELDSLSKSIAGYVNYWDFYFNCAFFAFSIWNSASGDFLIPNVIPALSQLMVIIAGGKKGVLEMYEPTEDQLFRQKGSGSSAYLEPISADTLNS